MRATKDTLISVIMSCHESNQVYLKESILSILNQTYENFELLIADNEVYFDLKNFVNRFNDKRIKYIDNCGNIGPTASYDNLAAIANGKYIAIQDHDDISLPNRLQIEKDELDNNEDIQSVSSLIHIFGNKNINDGIAIEPKKLTQELIFWQPIKQPTFMKRKSFCEQYKYDSNWMIYDYEFWSRTRKIPHKIINSILLNYRKSSSNSGEERAKKIRKEHSLIVQRNLKEINIIAPIELCEMLDPFNHNKYSSKFVEIFKENKDKLLKHISEDLYNRKLNDIIMKSI